MLKVLEKMRNFYNYDAWMVFVEQAYAKKKITKAEYNDLKEDVY